MQLGFGVIINPLVTPRGYLWMCPFCFSHAIELLWLWLQPHCISVFWVQCCCCRPQNPGECLLLAWCWCWECLLSQTMLCLLSRFFSLGPGQPHCLQGQQIGCWTQDSDASYALWGVCPSSILPSHHCLSWKILPRVLSWWGLASRLDHILHLWEISTF